MLNLLKRRNLSVSPFITVVEKSGGVDRYMDIYSRLMMDRIIMITGTIDSSLSARVTAQLLFLDAENPEKPINMYINSPGGSVTSGLAIYDTMQHLRCPIRTVCMGEACSMGSLLLTAGSFGYRTILPSARVMIHQPSGGSQGTVSDVNIQVNEMIRLKKLVIDIYSKHINQQKQLKTKQEIELDLERDKFLDPKEAVAYGLVDKIENPPLKKIVSKPSE